MSEQLLLVVVLALLPALGNFSGGLLAEWLPVSKRMINYALHIAAGIIIAVVAIEVMPNALGIVSTSVMAIVFLAGGLFYISIKTIVTRWQESKQNSQSEGTGAWMIYVAVAADLIGDGLLIGTATVIDIKLAVLLALAQVIADIPEGFATIANFKDKGTPRKKRLLLSASFVIPIMLAALFAYFVLRGQSEAVQMSGLVFVAGLYMLAGVEDLMGEAHEADADTTWSSLNFLAGFVVFMIASSFG